MSITELLDMQEFPTEALKDFEEIIKADKHADGKVSLKWLMGRAYTLGYINGKREERARRNQWQEK